MIKKTKIICTLGPSTNSPQVIKKLIRAGMDVVRLNFSHESLEDHQQRILMIRKIATKLKKPIAIIQDIQGPKIRVGNLKKETVLLKKGNFITISTSEVMGDESRISISYKKLVDDIKIGDPILLDDGKITLKAVSLNEEGLYCKIIDGGILKPRKGVNLPETKISVPSLTDKDRRDLLFGIKQGVDFIAISFVRKAEDVLKVKNIIQEAKADIPVIAKIEKPEAVKNIDKILQAADAVMIARGDLGVEFPLEKVPIIQKKIINKCNKKGIPVIVATQMLESMIENPHPTRAEASDIANAIIDGADVLMLSGETAVGKYPVITLRTMIKIVSETEKTTIKRETIHPKIETIKYDFGNAISHAASSSACDLNAKAIISFTQSGSTALLISKYRPYVPIIAATPIDKILRRLNLYWGVTPIKVKISNNTDAMLKEFEKIALKLNLVERGDTIVITMGVPVAIRGATNLLKLHCIE